MKNLLIAVLISIGMISVANASVVSLAGGLTLTQDSDIDVNEGNGNFNSTFDFIQWWDNGATGENPDSISTINSSNASDFTLAGIGEIDVNTAGTGKIFCSSCELTFEFGGIGVEIVQVLNPTIQMIIDMGVALTPEEIAALMNLPSIYVDAPQLLLGNAFLNVYLDDTPDLDFGAVLNDGTVDATESNNATNGSLWLELSLKQAFFNPVSLLDGAFGLTAADAFFSFDVVGGMAEDNFKQDGIRFLNQGLDIFGDILGLGLTSTFADDGTGTNTRKLYASGTAGNFTGIAVPEPSSVAFLGLSLLSLTFIGRRRKNS